MDAMNSQSGEYEAGRAQANRAELVKPIAQANREDGQIEPLNGLYFNRSSTLKRLHSVCPNLVFAS